MWGHVTRASLIVGRRVCTGVVVAVPPVRHVLLVRRVLVGVGGAEVVQELVGGGVGEVPVGVAAVGGAGDQAGGGEVLEGFGGVVGGDVGRVGEEAGGGSGGGVEGEQQAESDRVGQGGCGGFCWGVECVGSEVGVVVRVCHGVIL